ncbi:MAG: BPSS1780 family membrane protein [Lautropia sp.]
MQVRHVPAATGWRWVTEGFAILAKTPMPLIAACILMILTLVVLSAAPVFGRFLPWVLSPALSFGYLQAIRRAQEGKPPGPWTLFVGLRTSGGGIRRSLLQLGVINAVATALAMLLTALIDGGEWMRILSDAQRQRPTPAGDTDTAYAALTFVVLYTPIQLAMWYAPLFAGLHRTPPLKAMVFSAIAVWRNKGAFFFYFAGWFIVAIALSALVQALLAMVPPQIGSVVIAPVLVFLMIAALYCSFWPTYRDTIDPIAIE